MNELTISYCKIDVIIKNNMLNHCVDACAVCYGKEVLDEYEVRKKYIGARIRCGHDSVIEHSNLGIIITVPKSLYIDLLHLISKCAYMRVCEFINSNDDELILVISGSIRAYKHIYKNIKDINSIIIKSITKALYNNVEAEFFADMITNNVFVEESFLPTYNSVKSKDIIDDDINIYIDDTFECIASDYNTNIDINKAMSDCRTYTILFKNMSRTATHQLVRHRNGITQESQRYVNYSDSSFINPYKYKDKYDENVFNELNKAASDAINTYKKMIDLKVAKEDARSILPSNIACTKLYMTFSRINLIKFLELRTDKHAQSEIRYYANKIKELLSISDDDILKELTPRYESEFDSFTYLNVDEVYEEDYDQLLKDNDKEFDTGDSSDQVELDTEDVKESISRENNINEY